MLTIANPRHAQALRGKTVLVRVAYDVPLQVHGNTWRVTDTRRIAATLPTLRRLIALRCKLVLLTWVGRPGGKRQQQYSVVPIAKTLSALLKKKVPVVDHCVGPVRATALRALQPGDVVLLENVRFYKAEEQNQAGFAQQLVADCDAVVFDAFAQAHRDCPSITGILAARPHYAGLLMEQELRQFAKLLGKKQASPYILVLGGAKTADKIPVIKQLLPHVDGILLGGGPANVFLKAMGIPVGASYTAKTVTESRHVVRIAQALYQQAPHKFIVPLDAYAAPNIAEHAKPLRVDISQHQKIPNDHLFLDIGPKTIKFYTELIAGAKMIFWNGPMGVFEYRAFARGTRAITRAIAANAGTTIVGGGDTESVIARYRIGDCFTHVSTGGGASLALIAGQDLPGISALQK